MTPLQAQCINIIIEDSINTDSKDDFIASLLINGLGDSPLKDMTEEALLQEVYERCSYQFDPDESDEFAEDDAKLKVWVMKQTPRDWCERCLY